jgi:hypothetical protein
MTKQEGFGNFGDTVLTAAVRAIDDSDVDIFERFYDLSPSIDELNKTNKYGCTPLFVAVHLGKFCIARSLLSKRVNILVTNEKDNTIFDSLRWKLKHPTLPKSFHAECERNGIQKFVADIFLEYKYPLDKWLYDRYNDVIPAEVFRKCEISRLREELAIMDDRCGKLRKEIEDRKTQTANLMKEADDIVAQIGKLDRT